MLQQGVEYMRISPIIISNHKNHKTIPAPLQNNATNPTNNDRNKLQFLPLNYFVNFKGYREDKGFLEKGLDILENSLGRVSQKYKDGNPDFEESLKILKKESPELHKKFVQRKELFKYYEQDFNVFNETLIGSLNQVRNNRGVYTDFWKQNSKIGDKQTADIIFETLKTNGSDINKAIQKASKKDFDKIQSSLILNWYSSVLQEEPKSIYDAINEGNKETYKTLVSLTSQDTAKKYSDSLKNSFYEDFNKRTIDKIFNEKLGNEKKLQGFSEIVLYVEDSLNKDLPETLSKNLKVINQTQNNLQTAIDKESISYFKNDIKNLYNISINSWEEKELPFLLNNMMTKQIYNINAENQNPRIKNFQNYAGLSIEQKYFVSKYYSIKNNNYEDNDLLKIMIDDRNIDNPASIIDAMSLKIDNDRDVYFKKLDNFSELLDFRKYNPSVDIPERITQNPDDYFTFINMYLYVLGKLDEYQKHSDESKLEFLSTLTKEEIKLASGEIKDLWTKEELPFAIQSEVRKQANLTSINKKMFDELVKVNLNLNDIKIKMDNFTYSLKDLIENKYIIKDSNEIIKINQNASSLVSEAERKYNAMSEEQKADADKSLQETLPLIIDNLIKNESDKNAIEELNLLKTKCKTSSKAAKDSFGLIKTIIIGRSMSYGLQKGGGHITGLLASNGNLASIGTTGHLANAAGAAANAAGSSGGLLSSIPVVDPWTAAIVVTLALITTAAVGAKKATNLEKQQREIRVELK